MYSSIHVTFIFIYSVSISVGIPLWCAFGIFLLLSFFVLFYNIHACRICIDIKSNTYLRIFEVLGYALNKEYNTSSIKTELCSSVISLNQFSNSLLFLDLYLVTRNLLFILLIVRYGVLVCWRPYILGAVLSVLINLC